MKSSKFVSMLILVVLVSMVASTVFAASPYYLESRGEFLDGVFANDNSANGNAHLCAQAATREEAEKYDFCWWRDTTHQNAIADYSENEFTGTVQRYDYGPEVTLLVYTALSGSNVIALITHESWLSYGYLWIINPGGSRWDAIFAKSAFQNAMENFNLNILKGIILPDATTESAWGSTYWLTIFYTNPPAPIFASTGFFTAQNEINQVFNELTRRRIYSFGQALLWGTDDYLGAGSMKIYRPQTPSYKPPTMPVDQPVWLHAGIANLFGLYLVPVNDHIGTLRVYLTYFHRFGCSQNANHAGFDFCQDGDAFSVKAILGGDVGSKFLSEAASISQSYVPVSEQIAAVDETYRIVNNQFSTESSTLLLPTHGLPVGACQGACDAVVSQRDALHYIQNETIKLINYGTPLDDIATLVRLPASLADNPYTKEYAANTSMLVRSIYRETLGWFTADPFELTPMSTLEQAARFIDLAGGEKPVLEAARKAVTEHTLNWANWAFYLMSQLRQVYPSTDADNIYIAALKMLAYFTSSAQVRNYYLTLKYMAESNTMTVEPLLLEVEPEE